MRLLLVAITIVSSTGSCFADDEAPRFETHVRSILKKHCWQCHGEEAEAEGGLDLRLVRFMKAGGESGAAIVPGSADKSLLMQRLRDGEMPPDPGKQLTTSELETIEEWITDGAKTLRPEPETIDASTFITEEERSHWSFQPIERPSVPSVKTAEQVANPIDAFLLAKLEGHGFTFSPRAKSHTLIRRLYVTLHGLPPSPESVATFEIDKTRESYERLVDTLLNSSKYGERWARHWLDVAGYADSEGYNDADQERPDSWRYRDYVIRSLNNDKPFDQFIREQLAGDELISSPMNNLSAVDAELLAATGFLRMAPDGTGGAVPDANVARNETIADTIKIVSSALMGMTVGCAQCHDHRYDPISQADYYAFRAIFEPAFDWKKWRSPTQRRISMYTDEDRSKAAAIESEAKKLDAERLAQQTKFIDSTFEKQLAKLPADIHDLARSTHKTTEKKRTPDQKKLFKKHPSLNVTAGSLYLYDKKAADELAAMARKAKELRATKPKQEYIRALTEVPGSSPDTFLFYRGDHEQPKQKLSPAGLTVVSDVCDVPDITDDETTLKTSGRRLALAERLTNPRHPLTARVIVNRIWMHHFGRGLVTSPADFGILGQPPTHPKLLDWLAAEFMESGWSVKHIHRLILNSNAWQQQLRVNDRLEKIDPDNELYGGARLLRLDAEVIRDCMLSITGKLNSSQFGPAVPVMADRVGRFVVGKENLNAGRPGAVIDMKGEEFRRSIYIQVRRSRPLSVLDTFDRPAMAPNCDLRRPSTTSTQSLLMINSDLVLEYSRHMADRLTKETNETNEQIHRAWKLVYGRRPEHSEMDTALHFLSQQTQVFQSQSAYQPNEKSPPKRTAEQESLSVLCQMLLSSNEFLYLD